MENPIVRKITFLLRDSGTVSADIDKTPFEGPSLKDVTFKKKRKKKKKVKKEEDEEDT